MLEYDNQKSREWNFAKMEMIQYMEKNNIYQSLSCSCGFMAKKHSDEMVEHYMICNQYKEFIKYRGVK